MTTSKYQQASKALCNVIGVPIQGKTILVINNFDSIETIHMYTF